MNAHVRGLCVGWMLGSGLETFLQPCCGHAFPAEMERLRLPKSYVVQHDEASLVFFLDLFFFMFMTKERGRHTDISGTLCPHTCSCPPSSTSPARELHFLRRINRCHNHPESVAYNGAHAWCSMLRELGPMRNERQVPIMTATQSDVTAL